MPNLGVIGELVVKITAENAKETAAQIESVQDTTKKAGQEAKRQVPVLEKMGRRWGAVLGLVAASGAVAFGMILKSSPAVMWALEGIQLAFEDLFWVIGDELAPIFESLEDKMWGLADAFENASPEFKTLISGFVLGTIVAGILTGALLGLTVAAKLGAVTILGVSIGIGTLSIIIIALIAVIGLLYTAWKYNWFGIRDIAQKVWDWVEVRFKQLLAILTDENKTMFQKIVSIWGLLKDIANEVWGGIKTIISNQIKKAYDYVVDVLNAMKAALRATIRYFVENPIKTVKKKISEVGIIEHRQGGGPVSAGMPYMVGEAGPELFTPNISGAIIPNNRTSNKTGASAASSGRPININLDLKLDGRTVWESVRRYSAAEIRRLGG